jgi:hypothetical protein
LEPFTPFAETLPAIDRYSREHRVVPGLSGAYAAEDLDLAIALYLARLDQREPY